MIVVIGCVVIVALCALFQRVVEQEPIVPVWQKPHGADGFEQ